MKVAVYTIALNEAKHIKRWYESSKDADYHLIADTGSTDDTVQIAKDLGINVYQISVKPWRFDDARNAALCLLPEDIDYCISLDADEMLAPGWRKELQKAYDQGDLPRPKHMLVTDFHADGTPAVQFYGNRIHPRKHYRWKYPIHEVISKYQLPEEKFFEIGLSIHHRPDKEKSRGYYLPMLEAAYDENPTDSRVLYYYGRELFFHGKFLEAREVFKEYLKYTQFPAEKAYALRYLAKCEPKMAEEYLTQACETYNCRENVLALANHFYIVKQWKECLLAAEEAMKITTRFEDFMSEAWAWGPMAYDLAAISAWQLEDWDTALRYGEMALERAPDDKRLQDNVKYYREKVDANIRTDG